MIKAKITFLRYTLRALAPTDQGPVLDLFLSMLAIDSPTDFVTTELIEGMTELALEFPSEHMTYVLNTLQEKINYEKLSNTAVHSGDSAS